MSGARKPYDQWGDLVQAQMKSTAFQEREEKGLSEKIKQVYRNELDKQLNLKRKSVEFQRKEALEDALDLKQQQAAGRTLEIRQHLLANSQKTQLAEMYQRSIMEKAEKQRIEQLISLSEGRKTLKIINKQLKQENIRENTLKNNERIAKNFDLLEAQRAKLLQQQAKQGEKAQEHQQLAVNLTLQDQKIQEQRQKHQQKLAQMNELSRVYDTVTQEHAQKEHKTTQIIENWTSQLDSIKTQQEQRQQQLKTQSLSSTSDYLKYQITQKQQKTHLNKQLTLLDKLETDKNFLKFSQSQQRQQQLANQRKSIYNRDLFSQLQHQSALKSAKEKVPHSTAASVPGLYHSQDHLQRTLNSLTALSPLKTSFTNSQRANPFKYDHLKRSFG